MQKKEDPKVLYVTDRREWRKWLEANFQSEKEIWLLLPKKASGKKVILYNDAVEEALCFGWIDSIQKRYNEESNIQRYSIRSPKSSYSQLNKERIKWLYNQDMIHYSIMDSIRFILDEEYQFPEDIMQELRKDPVVWENYNRFSDSYKRIRIAYIDHSRINPEHFALRLRNFIEKTRENKQIKGYGGTDKYYE